MGHWDGAEAAWQAVGRQEEDVSSLQNSGGSWLVFCWATSAVG